MRTDNPSKRIEVREKQRKSAIKRYEDPKERAKLSLLHSSSSNKKTKPEFF